MRPAARPSCPRARKPRPPAAEPGATPDRRDAHPPAAAPARTGRARGGGGVVSPDVSFLRHVLTNFFPNAFRMIQTGISELANYPSYIFLGAYYTM